MNIILNIGFYLKQLFLLLFFFTTFSLTATEIYRWIDKEGVAHYSDKPNHVGAVLISKKKRVLILGY